MLRLKFLIKKNNYLILLILLFFNINNILILLLYNRKEKKNIVYSYLLKIRSSKEKKFKNFLNKIIKETIN